MSFRTLLFAVLIMAAGSMAVWAAGPSASPEGLTPETKPHQLPLPFEKLSADPGDFQAGAVAGANYLRYMQADVTEDNAGNGNPDTDTQDAGWDWTSSIFEHSSSASAKNTYGATANGMFQTYQFAPTAELFIAMKDAADYIVAVGPTVIRSGADLVYLLDFATLPGVSDPSVYVAAADAIWQYRLANYGPTATDFAEFIRDYRAGSYPNGIIPWDIGIWAVGVQRLSSLSGGIYDTDAADIAEVLYQDSFALVPGYFDVHGANKGAVDDYSDVRYWWYTLGVTGLIDAFTATGTHTAELPGLEALLMECQYDWGAFSYQYGANAAFNDSDDQTTAYACISLARLPDNTANLEALSNGAFVLSAWQDDATGAILYSDGSHNTEVTGECTAAMALAWMSPLASINATVDGPEPVQCGVAKTLTFGLDTNGGTPGVRGYELTLQVTGPVVPFDETAFADLGALGALGLNYFEVLYDGVNDVWIVNDAILGATGGLVGDADLFTLTLTANGDGPVDVQVVSLKLRDPDNAEIPAVAYGAGFTADCTAPGAVDAFTGAPGHEKADLAWTMADVSDVVGFEIYRAVWYDGDDPYVSAYPEYDDLANDIQPARPGSRANADTSPEWTLIHTAAGVDVAYTDNETVRGIYSYEIFTVDAAGNYGPPAADPVRVMNYWLGDVSDGTLWQFDGEVTVPDITALGTYFGLTNLGLNHPGNHVDVGPTHDNSRLGIPETDDDIDFEDLMIFAMNFEVVSPAKSGAAPGGTVQLAWDRRDDGSYIVQVIDANGLKGLRVTGDAAITRVTAGDLIRDQKDMTFLTNVGTHLDANLAVMGQDKAFTGAGDLLVIHTTADLNPEQLVFEARGFDNSRMDVGFTRTGGTALPEVFNLKANYPNPFNPMTTISFALPEAQDVTLTVYGVNGRRIATLLNEPRTAGTHEVVWMGVDEAGQPVASGTYFYRVDAGPYSQVRKMVLMK